MNEQNIKEQYESIASLLKEQRLKEAQTQLSAMLTACSNHELHSRLEQTRTSYQYMLQYMRKGVDDPERDKLHKRLLAETWEIADQAKAYMLDGVSFRYYQSLHEANQRNEKVPLTTHLQIMESFEDDMAICQLMPNNQERFNNLVNRLEEANRHLFLTTWGDTAWTTETAHQAQAFLTSQQLRTIDLSLFVSAVMLSLIECFDIRKCLWLIDAYQTDNAKVNQRALVGLVITLYIHGEQAALYPELMTRMELLNSDPTYRKELSNIYLYLLQSKETEIVDKKMREEIFPEVIKSVNMGRGMKFGFEDPIEENDRNPDWEKALNDEKFNEKLRQMGELQMEGADLQYSTFTSLKSNPFFNNPSNWFYPFDFQHPAVVKLFGMNLKENRLINMFLQSNFLCESDKYSLCFTLTLLSPTQRTKMLENLNQQLPEEIVNTEQVKNVQEYANRKEFVSKLYIQDIYRFYKCSQRKNEFRDIFKEELALHKLPLFKEVLSQSDVLTVVANFHFRKEHYNEALDIYRLLAERHEADADILQKAGFCLQKEKRYREAVEAYRKADVLKPDHIWTLRHLATCHRQLHEYEQALECYQKVEAMQPENLNLLFLIGSCLAESRRYDEALQYFFKMDFMENDCLKAWRAIAWCSLVCGKTEQAERYYEKILHTGKAVATDYLNAGHTAWVQGDTDKAANRYGQALTANENMSNFLEMFRKDKSTLVNLGIREEDIPLMIDLVL